MRLRWMLLAGVIAALAGCAEVLVLSEFGSWSTCEGRSRQAPHTGVDIFANYGEPVIAAADGVVTHAGPYPVRECGTAVAISHRSGARTLYCHLSRAVVAEGTEVKRGEIIGYVGTTGWTRPSAAEPRCLHVHFEFYPFAGPVDPMPLFLGCFDPKKAYPTDRLVLTYRVRCASSGVSASGH